MLVWRPPPEKPVVAEGILLEENKLVLFGGPKVGKSLVAQQLAFCVAAGHPWLGFAVTQGTVMYIQGEISRNAFHGRVLKMTGNVLAPANKLFFSTKFGLYLNLRGAASELGGALEKYKPNLLILDPLYRLVSHPDELSLLSFVAAIDSLIERHHFSIVLVHHSRKPRIGPQGIMDMGGWELRGPVIEQWADSIIHMRGNPLDDNRTLDFELRHGVNQLNPIEIMLNRQRLWFNRI